MQVQMRGIAVAEGIHRADASGDVRGDTFEAVGEMRLAVELLLEAGPRGVQRVAAGLQHRCAGQHHAQHAGELPVLRQLVREAWFRRAPASGALKVVAPEALPVVGARLRDPLRERHGAAHGLLLDHAAEVGQFAGAFDLRMGGEDLLDQGGAGARLADDEDGFVAERGIAGRGQRAGGRDHLVDEAIEGVPAPRGQPLLQGIGGGKGGIGSGGIAAILLQLAECMPHRHLVGRRDVRVLQQRRKRARVVLAQ